MAKYSSLVVLIVELMLGTNQIAQNLSVVFFQFLILRVARKWLKSNKTL